MKKQKQSVRFLFILCWAALAVAPRTSAQTPPGLDLQLYAGVSITGAVGTVYSVEYVTDLAQTNDWRCLTFLQPPATNYLWFDPTAPATGQRFYRAVQKERGQLVRASVWRNEAGTRGQAVRAPSIRPVCTPFALFSAGQLGRVAPQWPDVDR